MGLVFDPVHNMMLPPPNPAAMTAVADQNVFHAGTAAYYDTFAGLVPCKVLRVKQAGYGFRCGPYDVIEFKLTADRGAYKRGEVLTADAMRVPPQKMVRRRRFSHTIATGYKYEPKTPA
ncbi:MAG: hypothetical protein B7Z37_20925 [Verrucomicrobia bacterium 12-59-8]|nr:MAG: hypothetical protein B7Z37_20925 [Verrucomicrobia bacterium 12-59-8]